MAQINNPNNINYELYADEWRQECDNDSWSDDDNMVRIVVNTDASTGGTITWNFTNSCTSPYAYVRRWSADAPSSNTYANSIYSRVNSTSTTGALGYTVQSWETDNGFNCLPVGGDDCKWGPYTYTANYRDATRTPNQWWGVGGTNGSGDWSSTGQGRVRLKTIWRYTKGDNCSEPLDFGTLASGVAKTHFNSNKSIPSGARAEMGYTNTRDNAAPDVYYSFSITQPSTVVISTIHDNTTFDTYLRLLSSDCGTQIDFNDDFSGTRSQITRALCPGSYKILVEGYSTNTGNFNLSVQATTISTNGGTIATTTPSTICRGTMLSPFTSTVDATGMGSIAYQWESSTASSGTGFSNIVGATASTYTPNNVAPTQTTWYRRKAIDECGRTLYSNVIQIIVNSLSTAPTAITGTTTICLGNSTTLTASGYTIGTGGDIKWYSGTCGGTLIGTGASITVNPSATTTYYARIEGTCNTTSCATATVTVNTLSNAPTAITGNTAICPAGSTTLTAIGFTLGTGASVKWYSGTCGGTEAGTGTSITVAPTAATTYYARVEGICGVTSCISTMVTINTTSTPPTNITGTTTICSGASTTLTATGHTLGSGANVKWYEGACSGTAINTGNTFTVSPTTTTTYYARVEGTCNTTTCATVTVNVNTNSTPPTNITGDNAICLGQSATLIATGHTLGTGANVKWYAGACSGTAIGSGNTLSVSPSTTTTYYARVEGPCGNTTCISKTVTVNSLSTPITAFTGTTTICSGASTTLTATGFTLGTDAVINWYTGGCNGTLLSTGTSITVMPTSTTTYYARVEGTCNTTACAAVTVNVNTASSDLTLGAIPNMYCPNTNLVLSATATLGSGASIKWYTGANGTGTLLGTGSNITVAPMSTTTYYARVEGICNTSADIAATVKVRSFVYAANNVSATDYCTDNDGWHHFYRDNEIILSVKGNISGMTMPTATIRTQSTYYQDRPSGGNPLNCSGGWSPGEERFEMGRNWNLFHNGTISGTYEVRFYYPIAEKTLAQNAANNFAAAYPDCDYGYKYGAWHWFKNATGNYVAPEFEDIQLTGTDGNVNGVNYVQLRNISSFSGGSGAVILVPDNTLPIDLLYFTGVYENGKSFLQWSTASEWNNSHFEIQRSATGFDQDFSLIGTVASQGDSRMTQFYDYIDYNPLVGTNYYRLRQVDFDGSFSYSNIIALETPKTNRQPLFFPNPTTDKVTYQFVSEEQEKIEITIFNTLGQRMAAYTPSAEMGINQIQIDLEAYPNGVYIIQAKHTTSGEIVTESIIKARP